MLCFWKRTWAIVSLGVGTPQGQPPTGSPGLKMGLTQFWGSAIGLLIAKVTPGIADVKRVSWNEIVGRRVEPHTERTRRGRFLCVWKWDSDVPTSLSVKTQQNVHLCRF